INGRDYETLNDAFQTIGSELIAHGLQDLDYLDVAYFLFAVWESRETVKRAEEPALPPAEAVPAPLADFDHDELIEQLVNIGQWLGFQAEKEKLVAKGSRVDLIWQARI